jgi:hypothetical protein
MPLIKPPQIADRPAVRNDGLGAELELLRKAGIIKSADTVEGMFIETMHEVGLGPKPVLSRLAQIMDGGDSDTVKLGAVKLAIQLHMHPALNPSKAATDKAAPIIQFQINTPEGAQTQINLSSVLRPAGPGGQVIDVTPQNSNDW